MLHDSGPETKEQREARAQKLQAEIAARLQDLVDRKKITITKLAKAARVTPQAAAQWPEKGKISLLSLKDIAPACKMTTDALLGLQPTARFEADDSLSEAAHSVGLFFDGLEPADQETAYQVIVALACKDKRKSAQYLQNGTLAEKLRASAGLAKTKHPKTSTSEFPKSAVPVPSKKEKAHGRE